MWFLKNNQRLSRRRNSRSSNRSLTLESLQNRETMAGDLLTAMAVGTTLGGENYRDIVIQNGMRYVTQSAMIGSGSLDLDPAHTYPDNRDLFEIAPNNLEQNNVTVLSKFDQQGLLQWRTQVNGIGTSLAVDNQGDVYLSGYFVGNNVVIGSTSLSTNTSQGDIFLSKILGSSGAPAFTTQVSNTSVLYESNSELAISADGNTIYVSANYSSSGTYVTDLLKYQVNNQVPSLVWSRTWNMTISDIELNPSGQIVAAGVHRGQSDFDPNAGKLLLQSGPQKNSTNSAGFVMTVDAAGSLVWAKNFQAGKVGGSTVNSIAVDATGINVVGTFSGSVDFDPGSATRALTNQGANDVFFAKLSAAGSHLQSASYGSSLDDLAASIVAIPTGGYIIASSSRDSTSVQYSQIRRLNSTGTMQWVSTAEKANVTALAIDSATMEIQVLGSFFGDLYYTDSTGVRPNLPQLRSLSTSGLRSAFWLRLRLN